MFTVICTNPAKSASCPACEFDAAEWTREDALAQFATDYNLDATEVAVEE